MDDRSPETRRRARTNAPAFAFIAWVLVATAAVIGLAFLVASLT